ncbi:MAG TPA: response regulator [Terriglobia bacterium]|nr:response regulator [Terriglobia bacterium]
MDHRKIFLIGDDPEGPPAYAKTIAALGYDVETCDSYDEGARRIGTEQFDFVIVGQGGAAFKGRRVLEHALHLHRQIPILVVARSLNLHNYLEAMDLGAVDYLERPKPEDVAWVLESQLNRPHALVVRHLVN